MEGRVWAVAYGTAQLPLFNGSEGDRGGPAAAWKGISRLGKRLAKSPEFREERVSGRTARFLGEGLDHKYN
jgi:hypothetical protein